MTGRRRRITIEFEDLLAASPRLKLFDTSNLAQGYHRHRARLWRRKDGTYTARCVWRHPTAAVTTITFSEAGLVLR